MTMTAEPALPEDLPYHASPGTAPRTGAQLTQAMMDRIARLRPASTAEALRELRAAFPEIPLAARVTALEAMRRAITGSSR